LPETWLEYLALARYDLRLTEEEFWDLTPGMLRELCKRRNIGIKYDRYANAETAAAVYNVNRGSEETPIITAFDFVRSKESADKLDRKREVLKVIRQGFGTLPAGLGRSKILKMRADLIAKLIGQGVTDAEAIFDDCWPSLRPQEGELIG
jgi:hypothetical protein